jgi:hypothetical protein
MARHAPGGGRMGGGGLPATREPRVSSSGPKSASARGVWVVVWQGRDGGADRWAWCYSVEQRGLNGFKSVKPVQTDSNSNQNLLKLHLIQTGPSRLKNFEIKYGFDERDNFPYRNVFRFRMNFELKIREASRFEFE